MADKQPQSKRGLWFKIGRFVTGLTLACFFLPFFGVSCEGMDIVTFSGADMAAGCQPGGLMSEGPQKKGGGGMMDDGMGDMKLDKTPIEPLAIAAIALALVAFGLSWLRTRQGMTGVMIASVAAVGALIGLWIKVGGDMNKQIDEMTAKKNNKTKSGDILSMSDEELGREMTKSVMKDTKIDAGTRFGLYISIAGLLGAAGLCAMALKEKEGAELQPPMAPPPA